MPWVGDDALIVAVEPYDFTAVQPDPAIVGYVLLPPCPPDGYPEPRVVYRAGLPDSERDGFAEWAYHRLMRLAQVGSEPDGWQRRADGGLQLWCRLVASSALVELRDLVENLPPEGAQP